MKVGYAAWFCPPPFPPPDDTRPASQVRRAAYFVWIHLAQRVILDPPPPAVARRTNFVFR